MYAAPRLLSRAASVDLSGEPPCRGAAAMRASPTRMTPPKVRKNLRIMRQKRMHRGGCPHPPSQAKLGRRSASCARSPVGVKQIGAASIGGHEHIERSIVVNVRIGRAASHFRRTESRTH